MNTKYIKGLMMAGLLAMVGMLSGCADGGGGSDDDLFVAIGGGGGNSNCESDDSVLDGAQCTVTELVDDLGAIVNGTPLEPFIQCIDPLANDLVDGPDSVLQFLLDALAAQNPDPAALQAAIMDLATALASLGENLPNALLALSGDDAAIAACVAGPGGGGGSSPLDPTALCAIPVLGPQVVAAVGGSCPGGGGGGASPLDPTALCAIPVLGPMIVGAAGGSCTGGPGGGATPVDPSALCAVPALGPPLAGLLGVVCPPSGGSPVPIPDATALCAIPVLGPVLVGLSGGVCL